MKEWMSHPKPGKITKDIKDKVEAIIERFNQQHSRREDCF
jgi:hypothetical protein